MGKKKQEDAPINRSLDALPDVVDFRDQLFVPTLVRVPAVSDLVAFSKYGLPVLDQGTAGACTGFALATVANYLLRVRGGDKSAPQVSPWMLYAMAKRYDEWPGENYEGSSARGAIKGWFKHGLCSFDLWKQSQPDPKSHAARSADALNRPLGAYYRVNHRDLVAMHAAINEVGILSATASVHEGWLAVQSGDEVIEYRPGTIGGHAFAIVGYDRQGFWIQNSWGPHWGKGGLARLSYADWLANGMDVWVAALGAPVDISSAVSTATMRSTAPRSYQNQVYADLRPHVVTSKNNGVLDDKGTYGMTEDRLERLLREQVPQTVKRWRTKRLVLHAHGGLVSQDSALQTISGLIAPALTAETYPLSFIWRSDIWRTIKYMLEDGARHRRDEGILDVAKDFLFDRFDGMLEVVARQLGGKLLWDEMKENATGATDNANGAAKLVADHLDWLVNEKKIDEVHLVGHSAGSIFLAPLAKLLTIRGIPISSLTLWAPACTMKLFNAIYKPLLDDDKIERFRLYTLDDATEQDDDCANIYRKSLLYLVSHAFEEKARIPGRQQGEPLLGLARDASTIHEQFWKPGKREWHLAPGSHSAARHHGDFDNDRQTLTSTLAFITGSNINPPSQLAEGLRPHENRWAARRRFNRLG